MTGARDDRQAAEARWASTGHGEAAVRAGYGKALEIGWTVADEADIRAIVYAAYLAAVNACRPESDLSVIALHEEGGGGM